MATERKSASFLNGLPELLVLRLLAERPMYGYEIVAAIRQSSREMLSFGEGIIYPVLHELEDAGLLSTRRATVGGRPRVYYRLTRSGRRRLERSTSDWLRVAAAVQSVLGGRGSEPSLP
jgi:PadR family transcriptional regulator PadR